MATIFWRNKIFGFTHVNLLWLIGRIVFLRSQWEFHSKFWGYKNYGCYALITITLTAAANLYALYIFVGRCANAEFGLENISSIESASWGYAEAT
jgi:hypothetical protein